MSTRSKATDAIMTGLGLATAAGLLVALWASPADGSAQSDEFADLPEQLSLTGTIRDFHERSEENGHPDFEKRPDGGFGHYAGIPSRSLDEDGKPAFRSPGFKVVSDWRDGQGRKIMPLPGEHYPVLDSDSPGSIRESSSGAVTSADSFRTWFRDVPGTNVSMPLELTLEREPGSNVYVFDDRDDPDFEGTGGFFPANGQLFGNSEGENKNFHFTFELDTNFIYREGQGQIFTFIGDDDVFVYVDGKLVIDIGGVHSAVSQTVELDRLDWLEDGEEYSLKFFFAERHRTQSNFRIETTLNLRSARLPAAAFLFD